LFIASTMPPPLFFDVTPLAYFASLVASDEQFPLLEAAVSLAQDDDPGLDVQGVLAEIDTLGQRLRNRLAADAAPLQRLRLLNRFFFEELGFAGNVNDYHDRRNSLIPAVLATRRGIPISLAVLYQEIGLQAGLVVHGVSFPGHFLVKVSLARGEVIIDPFSGQSLSREELEERLAPFRRRLGGPDEVPLGLFLQSAPPRDVVARMLRNLKEIHRAHADWRRLERVLARLVVLLPEAWDERRDHALALAEIGARREAAAALRVYLEHCPDADDAPQLARHLAAWQAAS
jgi:regulator of sirC expression with transglutaminase-like and TPR domain